MRVNDNSVIPAKEDLCITTVIPAKAGIQGRGADCYTSEIYGNGAKLYSNAVFLISAGYWNRMVRYWVIPPTGYDDKEEFQRTWKYDRENGLISIGFGWKGGDATSLTFEEIASWYLDALGHPESGTTLHQVFKFWNDIKRGDRIVARAGRKRLVGVGTVQDSPFYDPDRMKGVRPDFQSHLPVQWDDIAEKEFPQIVFGMQTIYELDEARFKELVDGIDGDSGVDDQLSELVHQETGLLPAEQDPQVQTEFVLEKYLEEFIVSNFKDIFGDGIQIYKDAEGSIGQQYPTDIGIIDILAWDPVKNCYVVIELKKGKSSDVVVGQTLRYMGWVKEHLCGDGESVRGIVICRDQDDRLDYALSVVSNIEVQFYRVDFQLSAQPYRVAKE